MADVAGWSPRRTAATVNDAVSATGPRRAASRSAANGPHRSAFEALAHGADNKLNMSTASSPLAGPADRWVGVGRSDAADTRTAATDAVATALQGRDDVRLLIVYASPRDDLTELVAEVHRASGGAPMIGCTTAGEITADGPGDGGLVVAAFGGPGFTIVTGLAEDASRDMRQAGRASATVIDALEDVPHRVLVMLTDALNGDQQDVLRGAYHTAGAAIPLVGGCAADSLRMIATHQFFDGRVLTDAVVTAAIGSNAPFGIGVHHGWTAIGEPMLVTHSRGTHICELDGRPALDVYLDALGGPEAAYHDPEAFTRFSLSHPIGLMRRDGEPTVRFIGEADVTARSIGGNATVAEGAYVWLMHGDAGSVLQATEQACDEAIGQLGVAPKGLLVFDCVGRRGVLGEDGLHAEVDRIAERAGSAPVAGLYTYGEFARTRGINGFHNETLVVLAVG